jgi:ATP-dependent protease HslVU (ClpYQ) peptidase subunit
MRALIFCFSLIVLAGTASAAQITLDEDYMQTMEDRQKSLSNNIGVQNIAGANEDVKELEDMFGEVQEYYESKGNAKNAVDWSKDSKDLAIAIEKYVAVKDFDNATISATTLAKTCKECHRAYKKDKEKK